MNDITEKPWGYEELLTLNSNYVLKKLVVREGQRLSLQYHKEKRETWYILSGEGAVTLGNTMFSIKPSMIVDIPSGTKHRVFAGKGDLVIIEASTPELDDVVRLEDDYDRVKLRY